MKSRDLQKLNKEEMEKRLKELKMELIKFRVSASKTGGSKIKEIKKIIARILTLNSKQKELEKK